MLNHSAESTCKPISAVYVGENSDDFRDLDTIFVSQGWQLLQAGTWEVALAKGQHKKATHFLYEHIPHDYRWIQALEAVNLLPDSPSFILASRAGDEQLWAEVLNRGGYDLLLKPFDAIEVSRIIRSSWWYSHRHLLGVSTLAS